ncbi:ABC transporter ATP-binding protein [Hypericibacter terrae]|uniref:ABC transporter ATP-binding protein n=1 Tax=Hypericibacter terrae TaxID=2602015 RepID=A0A5J6MIS1_9PROT|nr:ABC transporter ATP-binding protein [Hypericibacter terrae]QEX17269.1 ABC transporter ATP-binding protein [Hypericibacter terrae]
MTGPVLGETIVELSGVNKRFDGAVTANNLSLSIEQGEFFTLLGPSGSGKSTVLRMIAGLERPDSGRITIAGKDVTHVPPWRRNLGMMFQSYAIFPHMTAAQNVGYGLKVRGWPAEKIASRTAEMLELVGLSSHGGKNATLLSGGEQQRVALARALAPQPAVLLLDEPLSALDEKIRRTMQSELKRIHGMTQTTFIYVTHDQEEALTMSDRIAVLNHGVCAECDEPERLYRRPRTRFVAGFFRGCNILQGKVERDAAGNPRVRIGGAEIALSGDGIPGDGPAAFIIRAENLHLDDVRTYPIRFQAKVLEVTYRGTVVDYLLQLADGQTAVASATSRSLAAPGTTIMVGLAREDLIALQG